jgi:hypothetical protein
MKSTGQSSRGIHRIASLMRCPAEYGYRYLLGLVPVHPKEALTRGTLIHIAMEALYSGRDWQQALYECPPECASEYANAHKAMKGYVDKYPSESFQVLSVEQEYECMIGDERLTRRLDAVVLSREGKIYALDHKSAYDTGKRARTAQLDPTLWSQDIIGRKALAPSFGKPWGGVILNLLPTSDHGGYERHVLMFPIRFMERAERSLLHHLQLERQIAEAHAAGHLDPWELAQAFNCYPHGYMCDYSALCLSGEYALAQFRKE